MRVWGIRITRPCGASGILGNLATQCPTEENIYCSPLSHTHRSGGRDVLVVSASLRKRGGTQRSCARERCARGEELREEFVADASGANRCARSLV